MVAVRPFPGLSVTPPFVATITPCHCRRLLRTQARIRQGHSDPHLWLRYAHSIRHGASFALAGRRLQGARFQCCYGGCGFSQSAGAQALALRARLLVGKVWACWDWKKIRAVSTTPQLLYGRMELSASGDRQNSDRSLTLSVADSSSGSLGWLPKSLGNCLLISSSRCFAAIS